MTVTVGVAQPSWTPPGGSACEDSSGEALRPLRGGSSGEALCPSGACSSGGAEGEGEGRAGFPPGGTGVSARASGRGTGLSWRVSWPVRRSIQVLSAMSMIVRWVTTWGAGVTTIASAGR